MKGRVKWFDVGKGYGFITRAGGPDVFVHYSAVQTEDKRLEDGEEVEFEIEKGRKGPQNGAERTGSGLDGGWLSLAQPLPLTRHSATQVARVIVPTSRLLTIADWAA